jgi:hypothetical protein
MAGICKLRHVDGIRWRDTHTKFHDDRLKDSSNVKVIVPTIWDTVVLMILIGGIYDHAIEIAASGDVIYVPRFSWGSRTLTGFTYIDAHKTNKVISRA